jgi:hypothetical protein
MNFDLPRLSRQKRETNDLPKFRIKELVDLKIALRGRLFSSWTVNLRRNSYGLPKYRCKSDRTAHETSSI